MKWTKTRLMLPLLAMCLVAVIIPSAIWYYAGSYGLNVVFHRGGSFWLPLDAKSNLISASMRLALREPAPPVRPGPFEWQLIAQGFEVGDLPAMADGQVADHLYLARIDPAYFRFETRNAPNGDVELDDWMQRLGAVLVVNGSYFDSHGKPDTPFLSNGVSLGPQNYDAKAGAFISSPSITMVRNLANEDWKGLFQGADNAFVSYPLLIFDGKSRVTHISRWLANRSFVGQDEAGRIIIGTTTDAFFPLDRLAQFLIDAPLNLKIALNLDGGPIACQGIALAGFERKTYGRWEAQVEANKVSLLTWPFGDRWGMPVVLAVFPK